jgi:hypothetical protein
MWLFLAILLLFKGLSYKKDRNALKKWLSDKEVE